MARKHTQGFYTFADGYHCWVYGLTADERKIEILHHGKIVKYEPTYLR